MIDINTITFLIDGTICLGVLAGCLILIILKFGFCLSSEFEACFLVSFSAIILAARPAGARISCLDDESLGELEASTGVPGLGGNPILYYKNYGFYI